MIDSLAKIGSTTLIFHPELVNIYGNCTIGQECKIGAFVEIKPHAIIGNKVKIEPFAFIPEGIIIEDEVFIGPHVTFTNDKYPRATTKTGKLKETDDWKGETTVVKKGASIGAGATILCGIVIGERSMVGAGAVVTKDVPPDTLVTGNPARIMKKL